MVNNPTQATVQSVLHPLIGPKKELHDLNGRVALVTGGALGIGFEISRAFCSVGCRVIMINRKEEQGQEAIDKIKKEYPGAQVEWKPCDLGNLKEVRDVFSHIADQEARLDLLICSAGINVNPFGLDANGIDRHFGVNWLGHFYAVNLLYPLLRRTSQLPDTPPPRIVFESSDVHRMAPSNVHFASLEEINNKDMDGTHLYARSKLAMILGAKGLVHKVIEPNADKVFALSVHPGTVNTDMQKSWENTYTGLTGKLLTAGMQFFGRDPEQGAYSALYAATSPEIEEKNMNGFYFNDPGKLGKETSQASDPILEAALWDLSTRLIQDKVGKDALKPWGKTA